MKILYSGWEPWSCVVCMGYGHVPDYGPLGMDFEGEKECDFCQGNGHIWKHSRTGTLALYPGGPLRGKQIDRIDRKE